MNFANFQISRGSQSSRTSRNSRASRVREVLEVHELAVDGNVEVAAVLAKHELQIGLCTDRTSKIHFGVDVVEVEIEARATCPVEIVNGCYAIASGSERWSPIKAAEGDVNAVGDC